jgi:RNAse (barnase) inhibitor barstar
MEKITQKDIDKIVELYTVQKVTVKDISKMCNVDSTTIWRKLKKLNLIVKEVPKTEAEMKEQERLYMLNKRAQPLEKFKAKQVSAIWDTLVINRNSVKKPFEVLFYPYEKYVNYIESQFTEGMTWVNYGEWVIEHVKPQPFFLFEDTNEAGYKECWDLTNLKLVWLKDAQGDVVNNHLFHD